MIYVTRLSVPSIAVHLLGSVEYDNSIKVSIHRLTVSFEKNFEKFLKVYP